MGYPSADFQEVTDAAMLRVKSAGGGWNMPQPAGTLPHMQGLRAASRGSGVIQRESQAPLLSGFLRSVLEALSNRAQVPRSLRSRL